MERFLLVILGSATFVTLWASVTPSWVAGKVSDQALFRSERGIPNKYITVFENRAAGPRARFSQVHNTANSDSSVRSNYASLENGGTAIASSGFADAAIDGNRVWALGGSWKDVDPFFYPDWLQVNFNGSQTIDEIHVYGVRDDYLNPAEPSDSTVSTIYGIVDFNVQYWNGSAWENVPGGNITGNNLVLRKLVFAPITTLRIRVVINSAQDGYSRIVELEAWGGGAPAPLPSPTATVLPSPTSTIVPSPTPTPTPGERVNVALASNGGLASASTALSSPTLAIDGVRSWAVSGSWKDLTPFVYPDWLQVDFDGLQTIDEIHVYGVRDDYLNPAEPSDSTVSTIYGIVDFNVQYWNGSTWENIPGGNIIGNNLVFRKLVFSPITTSRIRVVIASAQDGYSRIVEIEAWGGVAPAPLPTPTVAPSPTPTTAPSPTPTPVASPTATPVPSPTPGDRVNVALASNGGLASASTALSSPSLAIDGSRTWALGGSWKDENAFIYPDWLQVDFNGAKTIDEIHIYGVRDDYLNVTEPTDSTISTIYGIVDFDVQYWNGSAWENIPGGNITGNNLVLIKLIVSPITTSSIRVVVNSAQDGFSRIVEVEAWGTGMPAELPTPTPSPTPTIAPSPTHTIAPSPTPTPVASPTATPVPSPVPDNRVNVALASNGGAASASSALSSPSLAIDGVRTWAVSSSWKDSTPFLYPDWLQIDFAGSEIIDEINVYGVRDDYMNPAEPTGSTISTLYGIVDFNVQYWTGSTWENVPGGYITGNDLVLRKLTFSPITTSSIRVVINSANDGFSRIVEVEAWTRGFVSVPVYGYEVVNTYPHDPEAFTQGLLYHDGFLYESTGMASTLRKVEIPTGEVLQKVDLPSDNFGEGIALHDGYIFQLTWLNEKGRVFDIDDFSLIREFTYQGQGWGLTSDGTHLYMTDGTNVVRIMDPTTFTVVRVIAVMREDGKPLTQLNELEYVNGEIWANIWYSERPEILGKPNHIARIDPANGKLLGWINLDGISPDDVKRGTLNGIAYDAENDRIFVTGKKWTKLFEIKLTPPQ